MNKPNTKTTQTEQNATLSHSAMGNLHALGTVPSQKVITKAQMREIHLRGATVPAGYTVV